MPSRERPPRRRRTRTRVLVAAVVLAGVLGVVAVPGALAESGPNSPAASAAEWARTHGLGGVVTWAEQVSYTLNPPRTGGTVEGGITSQTPVTVASAAPGAPATTSAPAPSPVPVPTAPDPLPVPAGLTALPGEGQWRTLAVANGRTAARVAQVRPDSAHTSYVVSLVWMDPAALSFNLHPGTQVPGAVTGATSLLAGAEKDAVWATFNSGFQLQDAHGGYWQNGQTKAALQTGAASMVLTSDGHLSVVSWPGGEPAAGVAAVRQNLSLLIDRGQIAPTVYSTVTSDWGRTVGNAAYVWRSGVGVRADGTVVVACGPALSVATLAEALHAAGAQSAMELDINKSWTSFITYDQPGAVPHRLTSDQVPAANRYLSSSTRDFVAVIPRKAGA
jgi:Phosphodiester glycosidase